MRNYKIWLLALGVATVFTAIMLVNQNTVRTEQKLTEQIKKLEHKTKAEQNAEVENLKKQIQELDTKLQSKAAEKARLAQLEADRASLAQKVVNSAIPTANAATKPVNGSKADWMRAAGIPESDWQYVDFIVTRESGWQPCSFYPSKNDCNARPVNACGLVMQNPCGKIPGDWRDPIAALRWQKGYVQARYGGYAGAYNYWLIHHNY